MLVGLYFTGIVSRVNSDVKRCSWYLVDVQDTDPYMCGVNAAPVARRTWGSCPASRRGWPNVYETQILWMGDLSDLQTHSI